MEIDYTWSTSGLHSTVTRVRPAFVGRSYFIHPLLNFRKVKNRPACPVYGYCIKNGTALKLSSMKYYIAMFDGEPIAVSTKSERHAKALLKTKLNLKYQHLEPIERFSLNAGKVSRVITVEQQ